MDIEGLGRTQSVEVELEPAWGQMQISSVPEDAEVFVDGQPVGITPLTAEVLETGTLLSIVKKGYTRPGKGRCRSRRVQWRRTPPSNWWWRTEPSTSAHRPRGSRQR